MATGRIRRNARRGIALAVLGWLCAAVAAVLLAPTAGAAASVTVEIRNLTPPAASVDSGGTVTFVNKIPPQNKGASRSRWWAPFRHRLHRRLGDVLRPAQGPESSTRRRRGSSPSRPPPARSSTSTASVRRRA